VAFDERIDPMIRRVSVPSAAVLLCCVAGVTGFLLRPAALVGETPPGPNMLSEREKKDGWESIFDGHTTAGWMSVKERPVPASHVQDGALNPHPCDYMLVYERPLDDFILSLDFKISPGCNSGVFVRTRPLTPRPGKDVGFNGIEVAIDDTRGAGFHDTGAIYDLVRPAENAMKSAGEWNHLEVTCDGPEIIVVLNGKEVSRMNLDEWTEPNKRPDGTPHKFDVAYRDHPRRGYVGMQDHGSDCWFRDIKLKRLRPAETGKVPRRP
jgi:hypothetical protein